MINPFDVFFGPSVVSRLRNKPKALARIAERVKPLLMAAVHPDKNPEIGPEAAAEISEAYEVLVSTPTDELEELITLFLTQQRMKDEEYKRKLRDLEAKYNRPTDTVIKSQEEEIKRLRTELEIKDNILLKAKGSIWQWIFGEARSIQTCESPSRATIHHFRVILKLKWVNYKYRVFEFDINAKVSRELYTNTIEDARVGKGDVGEVKKVIGLSVVGCTPDNSKDIIRIESLDQRILYGDIIPQIKVGMRIIAFEYGDHLWDFGVVHEIVRIT